MTYNDRNNADVERANADAEALRNDLNTWHEHTEDMSYFADGEVRCDQCDKSLTVADLMDATYHMGDIYLWLQESGTGASYFVGIAARNMTVKEG